MVSYGSERTLVLYTKKVTWKISVSIKELLTLYFNTSFYEAAGGGDPVLYQHIFWFFGQMWPLKEAIFLMQWTISWNLVYSILSTICLSGLFYLLNPAIVKILKMARNQQETKDDICRVGSSETLRSLSLDFNKSELSWNQWLAGLIDGDGCFLVSKSGYTSCEITMGVDDEHALLEIKQKVGGSIKIRAGVNALRYRLHHKAGIMDLVTRVNGHIRNSVRLKQLELVCKTLNITLKEPSELDKFNGWFSGFFDADGRVETYSIKEGYPQLTISVTNKLKENLQDFENYFSGKVYFDKGGYGYYKWSIQSKKDVEFFLEYIKDSPSRSHKKQRLFLVPKYYKLKNLRAYKQASILNKAWLIFTEVWKKRG